jgi:hypothetical protein
VDLLELPLTFRDGLPNVEVDVGGERLSLMLDLGAYSAIGLDPAILDRLARSSRVTFRGSGRRFTDALGQPHVAREFVLEAVALGSLELRNVPGQELVFAPDFAPPNRDGYVGRPLVERHRVLLDYRRGVLFLMSGPPQPPELGLCAGPSTPLVLDDRGIVVEAELDGSSARFVLDTGSTHSLLRGPRGRAHAGRPYRLVVGPREITAFDFVAMDAGPPGVDGLLGQNFFEGRRVLLDFPGRRMWMDA